MAALIVVDNAIRPEKVTTSRWLTALIVAAISWVQKSNVLVSIVSICLLYYTYNKVMTLYNFFAGNQF